MKILYTLGNATSSGCQILFYNTNLHIQDVEDYQINIKKCFPETTNIRNSFFEESPDNLAEKPNISDIIWTQTGGNKIIGHAFLHEYSNQDIDLVAFVKTLASLRNKCISLDQQTVAMPLLARNKNLDDWNKMYPIIEEMLHDIQVIVYIPDEDFLIEVLDDIGGNIIKHSKQDMIIKFR